MKHLNHISEIIKTTLLILMSALHLKYNLTEYTGVLLFCFQSYTEKLYQLKLYLINLNTFIYIKLSNSNLSKISKNFPKIIIIFFFNYKTNFILLIFLLFKNNFCISILYYSKNINKIICNLL